MPHNPFLQIWKFLIFWRFQEEFMCTFVFFFFPPAQSLLGKKIAEYLLGTNGNVESHMHTRVCVCIQQRHEEVICPEFLMTTMLSSSKILMIRQIVTCLPESWRCIWTSNSWVRLGDLLPPDNNKIFYRILNGPPA